MSDDPIMLMNFDDVCFPENFQLILECVKTLPPGLGVMFKFLPHEEFQEWRKILEDYNP